MAQNPYTWIQNIFSKHQHTKLAGMNLMRILVNILIAIINHQQEIIYHEIVILVVNTGKMKPCTSGIFIW